MGLNIHGINFLRYTANIQKFGDVATIGRQELYVSESKLAQLLPLKRSYGQYCEELLLAFFGATKVDSFDHSVYEHPTYIADMNLPIDGFSQYDTIIDGSYLEHIYNIPQAFKNLSQLCCVGGQIIHVSPANNECGHGFWQFSPEVFYSLYSLDNGYDETKVFVASKDNEAYWYEVKKPSNGERAYIQSLAPLFILCRTKKVSNFSHANVSHANVQQAVWNVKDIPDKESQQDENKSTRRPLGNKQNNYVKQLLTTALEGARSSPGFAITRVLHSIFLSKTSLTGRNPFLIKRSVGDLVR